MYDNKKAFLSALEDLMSMTSTDITNRWLKFLGIIEQYKPSNTYYVQSLNEFDQLHNELIDLLCVRQGDNSPVIDLSQFKRFDSLMMHFRKVMESSVIQHSITVQKLDIVQDELSDLQKFIYEKEFKKLTAAISSPLKNVLFKLFSRRNVRIDPLDDSLINALLNDDPYGVGISTEKFYAIVEIYKQISNEINIGDYKDLVKVVFHRSLRNQEEHEFLINYIHDCERHHLRPTFMDLLNELNLKPLMDYKKKDMEMVEKLFNFYLKQDQYR